MSRHVKTKEDHRGIRIRDFAAVQLFFILPAKTVIETTVVQSSLINNIVAAWLDNYNYHIASEHISNVNINTLTSQHFNIINYCIFINLSFPSKLQDNQSFHNFSMWLLFLTFCVIDDLKVFVFRQVFTLREKCYLYLITEYGPLPATSRNKNDGNIFFSIFTNSSCLL